MERPLLDGNARSSYGSVNETVINSGQQDSLHTDSVMLVLNYLTEHPDQAKDIVFAFQHKTTNLVPNELHALFDQICLDQDQNRYCEIVFKLGIKCRDGVLPFPERAPNLFQLAADKEHPEALCEVGKSLMSGSIYVIKDDIAGEHYLNIAAKLGSFEAYQFLYNMYSTGTGTLIIPFFMNGAANGDANCAYQLGLIYEQDNKQIAINYFLRAATLGHAKGHYSVAKFYLEYLAKPELTSKIKVEIITIIFKHLIEAHKIGYRPATNLLAICYFQDKIVGRDIKSALNYLSESNGKIYSDIVELEQELIIDSYLTEIVANNLEEADQASQLLSTHKRNRQCSYGLRGDTETEFKQLEELAHAGLSDALFKVGLLYLDGSPHCPQDIAKGASYILRAAKKRHPAAAYIAKERFHSAQQYLKYPTLNFKKALLYLKQSTTLKFEAAYVLATKAGEKCCTFFDDPRLEKRVGFGALAVHFFQIALDPEANAMALKVAMYYQSQINSPTKDVNANVNAKRKAIYYFEIAERSVDVTIRSSAAEGLKKIRSIQI